MVQSMTGASASEQQFFERWDDHVERVGQRRAPGTGGEDVAQEARIRLLRMVRKDGSRDDAYIRAVVRTETLKAAIAMQRAWTRETPDTAATHSSAVDPQESSDVAARKAVRTWLATLPPDEREVYDLLYVRDLTQREAARAMGVSQPRITQIHKRLLDRGRCDLAHVRDGS